MISRPELKAAAKKQLGGGIFEQAWMIALLVLLLEGIIAGVAGSILPFIGAFIVTGPLAVGVAGLFLRQARGEIMQLEGMFDGFKNDFGGNFLLGLMQGIFIFLWSLLFLIPGIVKTYSYSMCFFIKNDHPEMDWSACLKESMRIMKGHKGELFVLDLSFIGWYIVGSLCCGVGTLWVAPYYEATRAQFYEAVRSAPAIE